jgi:hypothetical protein
MNQGDYKCIQNFGRISEERRREDNANMNKKQVVRVWTGFIWHRIVISGGLL